MPSVHKILNWSIFHFLNSRRFLNLSRSTMKLAKASFQNYKSGKTWDRIPTGRGGGEVKKIKIPLIMTPLSLTDITFIFKMLRIAQKNFSICHKSHITLFCKKYRGEISICENSMKIILKKLNPPLTEYSLYLDDSISKISKANLNAIKWMKWKNMISLESFLCG